MTQGIRMLPPPVRRDGTVLWNDLYDVLELYHRDILAGFDLRNPKTEFADGLVGVEGGVKVGNSATLADRPNSSIPIVLSRVTDGGRAQNLKFLQTNAALSASSIQDIDPLTAVAGPSTATIHIASHKVQADFGSIAYNGGSIVGLNHNTSYYVYADDPDLAGGAVSYLASTTRTQPVANTGRYFVGSITTPSIANTVNIIIPTTSANPISFTSDVVHGWNSADRIILAGLPGDFGTHLNGNTYPITVTGVGTFTIAVDGSGYTPYTSGGTATRIVDGKGMQSNGAGGGWVNLGSLKP